MEKIFGYDIVDGQYVVNPTEAEMMKYYINLLVECTKNPPQELVNSIYEEYSKCDPNYTMEKAFEDAKKSSHIDSYVEQKMRKRFATEIDYNQTHTKTSYTYVGKFSRPSYAADDTSEIIDNETFNKVQAILNCRVDNREQLN